MKVLDYEFSERFDKLYRDSKKKLKRIITFHPIKDHPNEYVVAARGAHIIDDVSVRIFINEDTLDSTEAEVTAAEDIVYALLRSVENFPYAFGNTQLDEKQMFEAEAIAGAMTASIHHLVVFSRLKELDFWIGAIQEKEKKELIDIFTMGMFQEPPPESLPFRNLVMRYIESNFYEDIDVKELLELFRDKAPMIYSTGKKGLEIVKRYGYKTPKKCLNTLIDLRDLLELGDKVWIMNAETELAY